MKNITNFINESMSNFVIDYFKKTFEDVTVEDRPADEFPNPFSENEEGDWIEIMLNDFDTMTSVAYDPDKNMFSLVVDSLYVIYDGKKIKFSEEDIKSSDATSENLKLYNKRSVNKICKKYENSY